MDFTNFTDYTFLVSLFLPANFYLAEVIQNTLVTFN